MDGIEEQYADKLIVIRVNIQDPVGQELAKEFGFRLTPTFILFDSQGAELWRSIGSLDPKSIAPFIKQE